MQNNANNINSQNQQNNSSSSREQVRTGCDTNPKTKPNERTYIAVKTNESKSDGKTKNL